MYINIFYSFFYLPCILKMNLKYFMCVGKKWGTKWIFVDAPCLFTFCTRVVTPWPSSPAYVVEAPQWLDNICCCAFFRFYADIILSGIHYRYNENKHHLKAKAPGVSFDQKSLSSNFTWVVEVDLVWKLVSAPQPLWPAYVLNGTFNYYYSSYFLTLPIVSPSIWIKSPVFQRGNNECEMYPSSIM